jgi:hypothetical protein
VFGGAGVPGSAVIVKVKVPSAVAAGIRRFGLSPSRNMRSAIGNTANTTTKSETPP